MRVKLEPFLDGKGTMYWSAQRVDDNGTPLDNYDGRGGTETIALANLKTLYLADQAEKTAAAVIVKKEEDLKAKVYFTEVKW